MNKSSLTQFFKDTGTWMQKRSPEILTAIGVSGMFTSIILAVTATPKALTILDDVLSENPDARVTQPEIKQLPKEFTFREKFCLTWRCYIPAAGTAIASAACLIGASTANYKRNAALATAYTLSETALKEYKDKVIETLGEKKNQAVVDAIAKDKVDSTPVNDKEVIIVNDSETLFMDPLSKRYFKSDVESVRKAVNDINIRMRNEMYVSLNEMYWEIGLDSTDTGNILGWHIDDGNIEVHFSAAVASNGKPCLVMDFEKPPKYDYNKMF